MTGVGGGMMRVTQGMLTQQFLYNITNIETSMQNSEQQLSTGKTLNKASDNPLAVSQDMSLRATISDVQAYQSTVSSGLTWMNNTSSSLQSIVTSLETITTNVQSGLNATTQSAAARTALSETVQQLVKGISQELDSKQGNRYLFGGTGSAQPSVNPSAVTGAIKYQISSGISVTVNVTASEIVGASSTNNLMTTLANTVADLQSGNQSNLQSDLQSVTNYLNDVININAHVGTRIQRLTAMQNQLNQYSSTLTNEKGVIEDANMAQVITKFNTQQTVYTAALKMGAQILQPSLVTYLP